MKEKVNVLVLGVGGNVSQGIVIALKKSGRCEKIVGACVSPESLGLYFCDKSYLSPMANDSNFISWVVDVCKKEEIDIVFSGVEEVIFALESHRNIIDKEKFIFISSPLSSLEIGNNKLKTCQWLEKNGLNYPKYADPSDELSVKKLIEEVGFPLIAKPQNGKGSSGIIKCHSIEDVKIVPKENYVIQECLGCDDTEYTIGCYVNKCGKFEDLIVFKRTLKYGTTFKAEIVHNADIEKECKLICEKFDVNGPLNVQLRMHKNKPVCFELNVRFSGTTALRANWGYNDVRAMIDEYIFDKPCLLCPQEEGLAYRYFNEAYVDKKMLNQMKINGKDGIVNNFNNFKESL